MIQCEVMEDLGLLGLNNIQHITVITYNSSFYRSCYCIFIFIILHKQSSTLLLHIILIRYYHKPPSLHTQNIFEIMLLFTPFSATRFAMHRIYANRINSRGMSRVFCDLRSQKTPRGILPVNSNSQNSFQIACGNGILACMSRDFGIFMPKHLAG